MTGRVAVVRVVTVVVHSLSLRWRRLHGLESIEE